MPPRPSSQTATSQRREQALADLERLSRQWQSDNDPFTRLGRRLSTTLELKKLIAIFAEELASVIPYDSLTYQHRLEDLPIEVAFGRGGNHKCEYRLNLEGQDYGLLRIFRRMRFAEQELTIIEQLLGSAIFAIRNACQFETVRRAALTDVVTGVPNKRAFEDALRRETCLAERHGTHCALILCDLDHFKRVNDTHGHQVGDQILRIAALAIQDATRRTDAVFRIGGEEFGILLPHVGDRECELVAERIRQTISDITLDAHNETVRVTASAGYGLQNSGETADSWFRRTDQALYRAKSEGRNCTRAAATATITGRTEPDGSSRLSSS
ncbi:GGDEF domain-containing protein [Marinobacter bohaiensis]|uniref:GGDEF domain-containing protein n=1 Tax=Marinobacter bohaiensis TaxID=2201898 RepID=UPI000DADB938|nr:GGDEF domain-containing protein [Marinobacter bohaiensis]